MTDKQPAATLTLKQALAGSFVGTNLSATFRDPLVKLEADLPDVQNLVHLNRKPPFRMRLAVLKRGQGVLCLRWAVHRLKQEVLEGHVLDRFREQRFLRKDELEFMPTGLDKGGPSLGTHTDPINTRRRLNSAVCLHCNSE